MKDFADLDNSSGSFPDVVGVDCSGPGETDGTELTADFFNDIMGAFQALLRAADETPSGTNETSAVSQIVDAIRKLSVSWALNYSEMASTTNILLGVAIGFDASSDSILVAVGNNGGIEYSYDSFTWTSNTHGAASFKSVYYADSYWVAVGANGTLYHATDPTGTWTQNDQGSETLYAVHHDGTYWVTVGANGTLYYTTDPTGSWTSNDQGTDALYDAYYDGTQWVVSGDDAVYYKATPDGTWTNNSPGAYLFYSTIYNTVLDLYITIGYDNQLPPGDSCLIYTAPTIDGSWTLRKTLPTGNLLNDIMHIGSMNIISCDSGKVVFSYDGINWTEQQVHWNFDLNALVYSFNKITIVGEDPAAAGGVLSSLIHG